MKLHLPTAAIVFSMIAFQNPGNAQGPTMGTTANFALFSTNGAVSNTGLSQLTGNVGTNNGSSTAFGNVDGGMHDQDLSSISAAADLLIAYNQLDAAIPTLFPAPLLGNGQTLIPGIYSIGESASLNGTLTLNGQNDPNALFIIQIEGAFSSAANAHIVLENGAVACNVFWKIEGLVNLATNTLMKGNIVANNAAIILNSGVEVEGRCLTTTGAVTLDGSTVRIPLGCGTAELTGPAAPPLMSVACYTIFSGNGEVTNSETTFVTGDVGTNVGLTTGFEASNVTGTIHASPDVSTAQCAADLSGVYAYLNTLPTDIELLYPALVGQNLELTPHTYLLDGATVLTNNLILNAQGNEDAIFVIKINGAVSTSTYSSVELINGAQAKNVFWKIDGATDINEHSTFRGTAIGNNGAIHLSTATTVDGRILTTNGAVTTAGITAIMTPGCTNLSAPQAAEIAAVKFYPNPFSAALTLNTGKVGNYDLSIYSASGQVVFTKNISQLETSLAPNLSSGMYFYKLVDANGTVNSGKLISIN